VVYVGHDAGQVVLDEAWIDSRAPESPAQIDQPPPACRRSPDRLGAGDRAWLLAADVVSRRRVQNVQGGGELRRQQRAQDGLVEVD